MNKVCRGFTFLLFLFLSLSLAGCGTFHIGVKESQINVGQYANPKEFLKNQDLATQSISEEELLSGLKKSKAEKLTQLNKADDMQKLLFGNLTTHADRKDISDISDWILSHHAFSLPYKNVRTEFYFDWIPISYNILEFGPDMNLLFITTKDENDSSSPYMLTRVIVTGTENSRSKEKEYIWSGLAKAIIEAGKKLLF